MAKISVYNLKGEEVEKIELSADIFDLASNPTLVHQAYVGLVGNERGVYAHTKTRAEVAGSGKKPWRQKGTGRARVGEVRNPVWRKGGIVFGPRNTRNFQVKVNQKMRRKAVMVALSDKVREGKLLVVESMNLAEKKTKLFAEALRALKIENKSAVVGLARSEKEMEKASRNVPRVTNVLTENVNVADLLNHQYFLLSKESVKDLEKRFLSSQAK
jgi:large subunit ribosomal protein L4